MIRRAIAGTVQQIKANNASATPAGDATGLAPGSNSTFFINHKRDRGEGLPWRYWLKCLVSVDISDQILVSQMAKCGPQNDYAELRPLTEMKANFPYDEYRFRNLVETVYSVGQAYTLHQGTRTITATSTTPGFTPEVGLQHLQIEAGSSPVTSQIRLGYQQSQMTSRQQCAAIQHSQKV